MDALHLGIVKSDLSKPVNPVVATDILYSMWLPLQFAPVFIKNKFASYGELSFHTFYYWKNYLLNCSTSLHRKTVAITTEEVSKVKLVGIIHSHLKYLIENVLWSYVSESCENYNSEYFFRLFF